MMRSLRSTFLITPILLTLAAHAQTPASTAFAAALQQKLDSCVNTYGVPGISATLLLPGNRYWNGAAGVANIYTQQPMDTAFLFQEASVNKLFTATLIMQLIDEGQLSLDDTIGAFLPPIENIPSNIRIRHLLKHRSGLADLLADPDAPNAWLLQPDHIWDPQVAIETFGADPLFVQGTAFSYSNTNYVLLGMIVERITGSTYAEALRARILEPLGLDHTSFRPEEPLNGTLVQGWSSLSIPNTYTDDMTNFLGPCFASMVFSAGALVSYPWDVARFNRELFSGSLLAPTTLDTMRVCTNVNMGGGATGYGFGTMRYQFAGRTYYGHAGDINGFTELTIHSAADSVTLTLSINRNDAPRGPIAAALLNVVFQELQVGVEEVAAQVPTFDLFPVPAHDQVFVRTPSGASMQRVELLDAAGRTVRTQPLSSSGKTCIDLHGTAPGIYHARVISNKGILSRTMVVE